MLKKTIANLISNILNHILIKCSVKYRKVLSLYNSKPPYVVSQCGQSFKEYIGNNYMPDILDKLKDGMDPYSIEQVEIIYNRILNFPEYHFSKGFRCDYDQVLTEEEKKDRKDFIKSLPSLRKKYSFNYELSECVFFYHHGLKLLNNNVLDYISNKDFLDIGSWIGDTALILHEYNPKKVISFDLNENIIIEYRNLMKDNNISSDKFSNEIMAVGKEEKIITANFLGNELSTGHSVCASKDIDSPNFKEIKQTTIDTYVLDNNLTVGIIQADIEGAELDMIKGAENTIKTQRPVLLIDIYHRPDQFFELKPLLESWNLNYKFMFRSFKFSNLAIAEVTLIAIPDIRD